MSCPDSLDAKSVSSPDRRSLLLAALLVVANIVVFGQVLGFDFLMWDDERCVVKHARQFQGLSLQSVTWAFTNSEDGWRAPLAVLSLLTDAEVYGLHPGGYHLTGLAIHIASTVLLFVTLRRMTNRLWAPAMAAALFGLHPLHVEPVAWVTGRWDLLCGFFWILGLWAYAGYCRQPGVLRFLCVLAAYVCALMSKPMALTFPFALLLLDYWPLQRIFQQPADPALDSQTRWPRIAWPVVMEKIPLFAVCGIGFLVALSSKANYLTSRGMHEFAWWERLANGCETYAIYVARFFVPTNLSFYYPHPVIVGEFSAGRAIVAGLVVAAITVCVLCLRKSQPYLLVGWFWYLGVLVPAGGWFQVEHHARADRYTYLPLIGLCLMVCWGASSLLAAHPRRKRILGVSSCMAVVILMWMSMVQTSKWKNNRTLFEYALRVNEKNFKALSNLGTLAKREKNYDLAESYFRKALDVIPGYGYAIYHLAICRYLQDDFAEAESLFARKLRIDPQHHRARRGRAVALTALGRSEEALQEYHEIIRRLPRSTLGFSWLGSHFARQGDWRLAVQQYQALALDRSKDKLPKLLAEALVRDDRFGEAVEFYESYVREFPRRMDIADELAWLLATHHDEQVRDPARAVEIAERNCRLAGNRNPHLLDTLAVAYASAGRFQEATAIATSALQLARAASDQTFVSALEGRLQLYQQRKTYLEPKWAETQNS